MLSVGPSAAGPQPLQSGPHPLAPGDASQDRLIAFRPQRVDDLPRVDVLAAGVGATKIQDGLLGGRRERLAEIGRDENGIQACDGTGYEADLPTPIDELCRSTLGRHGHEATSAARGSARCTRAAVSPVSTGMRSP